MQNYNECQVYVDHLLAEHRRLHALLRQARAMIIQSGGPDRDASLADVAGTLRHLRSELLHHFADEEEGGCLDEAVSRCPRLSAEAQRVVAEHPELLHEIDRLIAQALDGDQLVANRIALEKSFGDLCQQLHAHEAAENALLRQGFGTNVNGDEDVQPNSIRDF